LTQSPRPPRPRLDPDLLTSLAHGLLRHALPQLPLARASRVQHCRGVRPALGCRVLAGGDPARGRARPALHAYLCRADERRQPAGQCAARPRRGPRRSRGHRAGATARDRHCAPGGEPAGRHCDAAVGPVRARCAGVPPAGQRGGGRRLRRQHRRNPGRPAAAVPGAAPPDYRGGAGRRRPRVEPAAGARLGTVHAGGHPGRGPGGADLHQRDHRPPERRAHPARGADRQPAGFRRLAELVPAGRRRVLVAGRLGLDRRPDGCAAADAVLRLPDRQLPRPLQPGQGAGADAAPWRDQQFPVPDGAQDDDALGGLARSRGCGCARS